MMYLLDTDHISLLARGGVAGEHILRRVLRSHSAQVAVSIVSYEEQLRGWLSQIAATRVVERQVLYYHELERMLDRYCRAPILPFDARAAAIFSDLVQNRLRIGTMDLKIAAIALANDATLLTRNTGHFERVPGLRFEDWAD
jgi:tRNA(fMet)-specific endonuclease VapC